MARLERALGQLLRVGRADRARGERGVDRGDRERVRRVRELWDREAARRREVGAVQVAHLLWSRRGDGQRDVVRA